MHAHQITFDSGLASADLTIDEDETVYLVTGANRGIGWAILKRLALRPNTVIIACVRKITPGFRTSLENIPSSQISTRILICELPDLNGSIPSSDAAWSAIEAVLASLPAFRIDILIANAAINPPYVNAKDATPADLRLAFGVNTIGPLNLFHTFRSSLLASKEPKFIIVSSLGGSIELGPGLGPMTAYGCSKAAVNYLTRKIHVDEELITTLALDPGYVQTDMGAIFAKAIGIEPPSTSDESAAGVLKQIDAVSKSTSGRFINTDGKGCPW